MNITEFAKAAGVSKSAVSRYFNDGYVSEEKRENKGDKACGSYYTEAFKRELCKRGGGNKSGTQ